MTGTRFRLLAFKFLPGTKERYHKRLAVNKLFPFYRDVLQENDNGNVSVKNSWLENNLELTPFETIHQHYPKINVSALVGKNGIGKSTLLEAFYCFCYNLSAIEKNKKTGIAYLPYESIHCEVYFELQDCIFCARLEKSKLTFLRSDYNGNFEIDNNTSFEDISFFTLAIDYSLYGLNENFSKWARTLFHKNDGYKIPLVINPFRSKGNIDVNKERHLVQSRLLINLYEKETIFPEILKGKFVETIKFTLNKKSIGTFDNIILT